MANRALSWHNNRVGESRFRRRAGWGFWKRSSRSAISTRFSDVNLKAPCAGKPMSDENDFSESTEETHQPVWIQVLRWIGTFPAAVLGSGATYLIARLIRFFMRSPLLDEYACVWLQEQLLTSALMGAAFVYSASLMAPKFKRQTAVTFAAMLLCLSGAMFFPALRARQYMFLVGLVCTNIGSISLAVAMCKQK